MEQDNVKWICIEDKLPDRDMVVRWLCADGVEDIGFFYKKDESFATIDIKSDKEITHWKPNQSQEQDNVTGDIGETPYLTKSIGELLQQLEQKDAVILHLKAEIILLDQAAGASAELLVRVMELEEERLELKDRIAWLELANTFHQKAAHNAVQEQHSLMKQLKTINK